MIHDCSSFYLTLQKALILHEKTCGGFTSFFTGFSQYLLLRRYTKYSLTKSGSRKNMSLSENNFLKSINFHSSFFSLLLDIWGCNSMYSYSNRADHQCWKQQFWNPSTLTFFTILCYCFSLLHQHSALALHGLSCNQSFQDYEHVAYQEKTHPPSFPELVR